MDQFNTRSHAAAPPLHVSNTAAFNNVIYADISCGLSLSTWVNVTAYACFRNTETHMVYIYKHEITVREK